MSIRFRPDIEGLRAVAILPVVAFHANPKIAPGGYIGVDVFFVISGYLITSLLLKRLEDGQYSIAAFYRARIRRIFPALFFMLLGISLSVLAVLPPSDLIEFGKTLIATALFVSNIEFIRLADYFAGNSDFKPLLHTWSLAVEEQFYIFFPLLLSLAFKWWRRDVPVLIIAVAIASLVASVWATTRYSTINFYFSGTRAFELLLGAFLATGVTPLVRLRALREVLSIIGLVMIGTAVFQYDRSTPFPGVAAMLPCVGAALLIHAGAGGSSFGSSLLCIAPLRWVGLISYSLYLWHWPVIVFFRHYALGEVNVLSLSISVTIALFMSIFSFKFVEKPFRHVSYDDNRLFAWGVCAIAMAGVIGAAFLLSHGLPMRFNADARRLFETADDFNRMRKICHGQPDAPIRYDKHCVFGAAYASPTVAVWGDSHGAELSVALGDLLEKNGGSVMQITSSACPPSQEFVTADRPHCGAQNRDTLENLSNDDRIHTVVVIARYSLYFAENPEGFSKGLEESVKVLVDKGKRVVAVTAIPDFNYPVPIALGMLAARGEDISKFGRNLEDYRLKNSASTSFLASLEKKYGVRVVDASSILCERGICPTIREGKAVMYFDDNHLSLAGARYVAAAIVENSLL